MPSVEGMPVALRPVAIGTGGMYRLARRWTPIASQTAGIVWSGRNPNFATTTTVITSVRLRAIQIGNPTAAVEDRFSLWVVRGNTGYWSGNGTLVSNPTGKCKLRTNFADPNFTIYETTAAGGLTGGVGTVDTAPIANGSVWILAAVPTAAIQNPVDILDYTPDLPRGEYPIVLAPNEGIHITCDNALGAASGIILLMSIIWAEVDNF